MALTFNLNMYVLENITMPQTPIKKNERLELTQRDSLHVMNLLDEPPAPNKKLMAAAFALSK